MNDARQYIGKKWPQDFKIFLGLVTTIFVALMVDCVRSSNAELKTLPPDLLAPRPYLDAYFCMSLFQAGLVTLAARKVLYRWRLFFVLLVAIVFLRWCGVYAYIQMYEMPHRSGIGKFFLFDGLFDSLAIYALLRSRYIINGNVQAPNRLECLGLGFASYLASIFIVAVIGIAFAQIAPPSAPVPCKTSCPGSALK